MNEAPHKCPVCGGRMKVPGNFYTGGDSSTVVEVDCRSCVKGIVWTDDTPAYWIGTYPPAGTVQLPFCPANSGGSH